MYRNRAKIDAASVKPVIDTPVMAGRRNSERSSIGYDTRSSATMNNAMLTALITSRVTILGLPQPSGLPRIRARTSVNSDTEKVTTPDPVDLVGAGGTRFLHLGQGEGHGDHADRHVDEEDPAPADSGSQGPADERAHGHRPAEHRPVDPEGRAPLAALEGRCDQGHRRGEHDGPADTLDGPGDVQHQRGGRQAADQRGQSEEAEADGEDLPAPAEVAQHAGA